MKKREVLSSVPYLDVRSKAALAAQQKCKAMLLTADFIQRTKIMAAFVPTHGGKMTSLKIFSVLIIFHIYL